MLISLGFLVLIVLMSAGIAVIADNVGRKLGKKRMSFKCRAFSVRPKYVAQIGTALTGAAVSLATIIVVAVVSKDVRDWIVLGRAAIAQAEAATTKNRELQAQMRARESTIQSRDTQIKSKDVEISRKTSEVAARTKEVEAGRAEVERQRAALASLNVEVGSLRKSIPTLRSDVERARKSFEEANKKLHERQKRLASVSKQLAATTQLLTQNEALLKAATTQKNEISDDNTRLMLINDELIGKQRKLQEDITNLEDASKKALLVLESTKMDLEAEQRALAVAQGDLRELESQLREARIRGNLFKDISAITRYFPLTFRRQEEVARITVEEGLSQANAEAAMERLLRAARLEALKRGAKATDRYPEASIVERRNPLTKEEISGEELQRQLVRQIVGGYQPLVIVAYSTLNAFKGEPVSLDIGVYPNPLVYKQGQLIAESKVDGRRDDSEIYRQVSAFVDSKLRDRARQDRMIPSPGTEDTFASIDGETMLKLVGDVKAAERPVRLIAFAASDTRAGDPLKLAFQIR